MKTLDQPSVKERPILFNGEMVRAILDGTKTQTRRLVKGCVEEGGVYSIDAWMNGKMPKCPYGTVGDRLWVRETWAWVPGVNGSMGWSTLNYKADGGQRMFDGDKVMNETGKFLTHEGVWRPSIHMPHWASRITLEITNVRVERLQDISEEDAKAEGVEASKSVEMKNGSPCYSLPFQLLWNRTYGCDAWEKNPWLWVVEFKKV